MLKFKLKATTIAATLLVTAAIAVIALGPISPAQADESSAADNPPPINMNIKSSPIADVLRMLGRAAGVDIVINEGVSGTVPSMDLKDKSIEEALYLVAQTNGYLVFKAAPTTYIVSPPDTSGSTSGKLLNPYGMSSATKVSRSADTNTSTAPAATSVAPTTPATAIERPTTIPSHIQDGEQWVYDQIELAYLDATQVAEESGGGVFGGRQSPQRVSPYYRNRHERLQSANLPFTGEMAAPAAPFAAGWSQYGRGEYGGGLGGGLGDYYGQRQTAYGSQQQRGAYGGYGGGMGGVSLPTGMEPPLAILEQNVLLVHGMQEAIDQFREILAFFDKPPKQVEIATKFIEVETTEDKAFGIDWFVANGSAEFFNLGFAPGMGINVARFRRGRFEAELRTLLSEGRAQVVNAPRVTTQNNLEATVDFSTEIPYFYSNVTYDEFGHRTVEYETESVSVSQSLTVTPRILEDDSVVMDLEPNIEDQVGTVVGPDGQTLPIISSQTAYTRVRVLDGDTLVIGGFTRTNESFNIRKTPLLHNLPIIGNLFRSRTVTNRKSELLIFVTPTIVREIPQQ